MKIYETHKFDSEWNDKMGISWYRNEFRAMADCDKHAGKYVEWKQMTEHLWAGRMSNDFNDDFYIIYVREVLG